MPYKVGDRVKVKAGREHDSMTKDKAGTVKEVSTPALAVLFDGMDELHKWYVDDELEDADEKDGKQKNSKPMKMAAGKHQLRRVISAVYSTPWAITDAKFSEILSFLDRRAEGHLSDEEIQAAIGEFDSESSPLMELINGVAVINIDGTISHRANFLSSYSGGTSTEQLTSAFRAAIKDTNVNSILFRIDSPGGTVPGVPELAKEIMAARGTKPMTSFVSPMMASAAYWIGSAADRIVAMPSAEAIGSIGVRLVHVERSKADERQGVTRTQLAVPAGKGAINDFSPLTDESRTELMSKIESIYADFAGAVARHRNVSLAEVADRFGGGRTFLAGEALSRGLVDRLMTFDELLAELAASSTRPTTVAVGSVPKPAFYRVSEDTMNKLVMEALVRRGLCSIDATEEQASAALNQFFASQGKAKPAADLDVVTALAAAPVEQPKPAVTVQMEAKPVASDGMSLQALSAMVSIAPLSSDSKLALISEFSKTPGISAQQVADRINKVAAENNAPAGATIAVSVDAMDKLRAEARDAILMRTWGSNVPQTIHTRDGAVDFKPSVGARSFHLSRLQTLARQVAIACGVPAQRIDAMVPADLAQLAMGVTGGDSFGFLASDMARNVSGMYSNILLDASNVILRRAYDDAPVTFQSWTRQGESLPDFKVKNLVTFGELPDPKAIPENGEFEEVTTTDSKESYKLVNWGEIFSVSWEAIVNDQLSAFTRVPQMQGSAMRRKQNRLVYAILLNNPTMADTGALFNATAITTAGGHDNLTTGAGAPSVSTLNTLTQKMMEQKGADTTNGGILNLMPTYIIACPALRGTILELLGSSSYAVSNGNSGIRNIWQGALTPIIEGELGLAAGGSDTAWYLAASPSQIDTIEYAYLAGYETPRLDRIETYNRLGSSFRIYQPFAAKAVDYRGLQKHAGA